MAKAVISEAAMATDPVCGMMVDTQARKPAYDHGGHTYYFCSEGCRSKFAKQPQRYLDTKGDPEPLPQGTLTPAQCTRIVQEGPGHCPICGMALEPMGVPPEDTANPEPVDFTRRLMVAVPLSLALVLLEMSEHVFGIDLLSPSSPLTPSSGFNWRSPFPPCSGAVGPSSSVAGNRSARAISICSR